MLRVLSLIAVLAAPPPSAVKVSKTEVVTFQPNPPAHGAAQSGSCWTNSIAVDRPGAWRCMIGNEIHDPCFSSPAKAEVVCGANPADRAPGFLVHLTEPLPPEVKHGAPQPWLLELGDGTVCEAVTGTLPPVAGEPARWACATADPKVYSFLSSIHPGKVWTAQRFELAKDPAHAEGFLRKNPRQVELRAVWR